MAIRQISTFQQRLLVFKAPAGTSYVVAGHGIVGIVIARG